MSKLLGIVNPHKDPTDPYDYWLWRAAEGVHPIRCDYEQLSIEKTQWEGNIRFRILGPGTPQTRDGVYLIMAFNPDHDPTVVTDAAVQPAQPELNARVNGTTAPVIVPVGPVASEGQVMATKAPFDPQRQTVATAERLDGETKAQWMRRKASALRWQANQIEEAAERIEALEAQGLI